MIFIGIIFLFFGMVGFVLGYVFYRKFKAEVRNFQKELDAINELKEYLDFYKELEDQL